MAIPLLQPLGGTQASGTGAKVQTTDGTGVGHSRSVTLAPSAPGNFTVAHGLGATPLAVIICMTSGGAIWFQSTSWDGTNIYLTASASTVTGKAIVLGV